jgi:hypothetical protein
LRADRDDLAGAHRADGPQRSTLDRGESVDPASCYFRLCGFFETGAPHYDWLNRIIPSVTQPSPRGADL